MGKVKVWFVWVVVALSVSLPFSLAYYYYRSRAKEVKNNNPYHQSDVEILAKLDEQRRKEK